MQNHARIEIRSRNEWDRFDPTSIGASRTAAKGADHRFQSEPSYRLATWQVRNPFGALDDYFTDVAAWDLIASKLEEGHEVEAVQLREPPGRTGYVMKIELEAGKPMLYVKLELGSGRIFGRSFHYSER